MEDFTMSLSISMTPSRIALLFAAVFVTIPASAQHADMHMAAPASSTPPSQDPKVQQAIQKAKDAYGQQFPYHYRILCAQALKENVDLLPYETTGSPSGLHFISMSLPPQSGRKGFYVLTHMGELHE